MKQFISRSSLTIVSLCLSTLIACGQRSSESPSLGTSGLAVPPTAQGVNSSDKTAELEKLIRTQLEALTKLSTDKATLQERSEALDAQIKALNEQLTTSNNLTTQAKVELQKKIEELSAQKAEADKQMTLLTLRNAELQKQLDDAKAANAQLQRDLEAAKKAAAQQTASTTTAGTTTTGTTTTTTGKFYAFRYADPNKVKNDCLDVPSGNTADFVQLISFPCGTGTNQQYSVVDPSNQFFQIKPRSSGKCMTASSAAENAAVIQKTCGNTADQNWEFFVRGQMEFRLRNQSSGKCLKIAADGKIIQGDCSTNSTYFDWIAKS